MKVNVTLEIMDHGILKFYESEIPLKEFQKDFPLANKAQMIRYMEKFNLVWCKTFRHFVNVGPIIDNLIK